MYTNTKSRNNCATFVESNIHIFLDITFQKIGLFYNRYLFNIVFFKNIINLNVASYTQWYLKIKYVYI